MSPGINAQEAASIKLGETELTPAVRVDYVSIDNLYRLTTDEVSGSGVLVKPDLVWQADRRLLTLNAQYTGDYGTFSEDGLDYDNHYLALQGIADLSSKQGLAATLSFRKTTEAQGTGQTIGALSILDEQIEVSQIIAQARYRYGALDARGNLSVGVTAVSYDYKNLEQFTDGDDYSYIQPNGVFSLRISPDTRVLAEVRFASIDFDDDRRDRDQVSLLAGVELASSSKLSGDARIGATKASFDQDSDDDTTTLIAEVGLVYSPVSYSTFSLDFDRGLETEDQSDNNAGRSVVDSAEFSWTHDWSSRFQTQATVSLDDTDRECPSVDEQVVGVGLELNFQIRRWLQFGVSGAQSGRTVTACEGTAADSQDLDYDRSVVGVHVRATL